jgi:hypothetical protein
MKSAEAFPSPLFHLELLIPLIFVLGGIGEIFFFPGWPGRNWMTLAWIANVVFLNAVHVAFPLSMFLVLPEFRRWSGELSVGARFSFRGRILAIHAIFVALMIFLYLKFGHRALFDGGELWLLGAIIPNLHALAQQKGILSVYHRRALELKTEEPPVAEELKRFYGFERRCIHVLMVSVILGELGWQLIHYSRSFHLGFSRPSHFDWIYLGFTIVPIVALLVSSVRYFSRVPSTKPIFILRLLVWPLSAFSTVATFGIGASHGLESLTICHKFYQSSAATPAQKRVFLATVVVVSLLIAAAFSVVAFEFTRPSGTSRDWAWIFPVIIGLAYAHYLLDHLIFKFRNPITAQAITPLLS